jgi:hypothetical protein
LESFAALQRMALPTRAARPRSSMLAAAALEEPVIAMPLIAAPAFRRLQPWRPEAPAARTLLLAAAAVHCGGRLAAASSDPPAAVTPVAYPAGTARKLARESDSCETEL